MCRADKRGVVCETTGEERRGFTVTETGGDGEWGVCEVSGWGCSEDHIEHKGGRRRRESLGLLVESPVKVESPLKVSVRKASTTAAHIPSQG